MKREARTLAGSGVAVAALGLGAHVFTWGNPVADKITMWVFIIGAVLGMVGYLAGAGDSEGSEGP
jgi:cytochrome bd-type quinol oxidase subunit 1